MICTLNTKFLQKLFRTILILLLNHLVTKKMPLNAIFSGYFFAP